MNDLADKYKIPAEVMAFVRDVETEEGSRLTCGLLKVKLSFC